MRQNKDRYRKDTEMVHGGQGHDESKGALNTPIYQSSAFVFNSAEHGGDVFAGECEGHVYTRIGNPTTQVLEAKMARLENCEDAVVFASGMAAETAVILSLAQAGDNVVADDVLYGGTHAMLKNHISRLGIEIRRCDTSNIEHTAPCIDDKTRVIFTETPANPTLKIVDLKSLAAFSREKGIPLCVDSTFATPYLQRPADLGADLVLHSATKFIGGHGDVVAGVVCSSCEITEFIRDKRKSTGACLSPFDSWLLLRGLKTLGVRVKRECASAMEIAKFLSSHPKVEKVYYPGLPEDPYHEIAKKQMDDFGAIVTFDIKGGIDAGRKVMNSVRIHTLAVSLGDCDTLIEHPASMTHSMLTVEEMAEAHITPGMIRVSVGLEDHRDLIEDLEQSFEKI